MGTEFISTTMSIGLVILLTWVWRVVMDNLWWGPKRLEKCLREQGYGGNPYRLWHGDLKDMASMTKKARSRPIKFSDDIVPYVLPFHHHIVEKYDPHPPLELSEVEKADADTLASFSKDDYLPTKTNKRMKEIHREVHARLRDMIIRREKALTMGEAKNQDLLGLLLETNLKEIEANGNKHSNGITIEDVIEECKLFYFAGEETTTNLLAWTMVMLGQHQEWQARARDEVLEVLGQKKEVNLEALNRMKIVTMILNEVLRMYPPAPILIRTTHETTKLGNIILPPRVELLLMTILLHHDSNIWGADAKEFNPGRFSDEIAKVSKNTAAFCPFGSGPRICVRMNLTMAEAKLVVAMILQKFSFEISPSYEHAPFPILTLQPFYGVKLILHKNLGF